MTLLSEAHVLAETSQLSSCVLDSLLELHFGTYALGVSRRLTSVAYLPAVGLEPASSLELGVRDVAHAVGVARENGMALRIGDLYLEAAGEAIKYGLETGRKCDSSAVYGVVRRRAGLEFETRVVRERDGMGEGEGGGVMEVG
ncbi:uncharacterized protein SETTUDRAFT_181214 [Exserohilum turcica Et28A]|uniref:Uncharacterized protein n=1 Tax=Exserohilum turcicum (strain 28A) TaxID=671987 RepID=R0K0C8_EXST2|nr:uncharacterized protein SETTUDRAFT_181214 [Exserohilum turcica Et28A]EOA81917.1 hypothetical protein SETTUDRAFT_181214 [Exserohilum turcica Et28A]